MKKNYVVMISVAIILMVMAACGRSVIAPKSPISKYCDRLEDIHKIFGKFWAVENEEARDKVEKEVKDNIEELKEEMLGMELKTENAEEPYFEIIKPFTVTRARPTDGAIDFEAVVKPKDPTVKMGEFYLVACAGSEPITIKRYTCKYNDDDSIVLDICQVIGNIIHGGEKIDEKLRSIDRIVIAEDYSELVKKLQGDNE